MNFFGTVRQNFSTEKRDTPYYEKKKFDTPNFLKHWRDAHEIFRHCETWNFRRKIVIPPFSSKKYFETWNFLKNSGIPSGNFSALWDIKILIGNCEMPTLIHKFISIPEFFWKTDGFLYKEFPFGPVKQKTLAKSWCPPSYAWKVSIKEFFWNTTVFSNEIV